MRLQKIYFLTISFLLTLTWRQPCAIGAVWREHRQKLTSDCNSAIGGGCRQVVLSDQDIIEGEEAAQKIPGVTDSFPNEEPIEPANLTRSDEAAPIDNEVMGYMITFN